MLATRKNLFGLWMTLAVIAILAITVQAQQTSTEKIKGEAAVTTEKMSGRVVKVEGNSVVVKMSSGELRTFNNVPDSRKAMIDGKEVGVRDLQPGTTLSATITRTMTPITVRTTTVGTGKVWFVSGPNVILTLPNGENKQYKVKPDYKFIVNGKPATVYELRAGMTVSAEKIVEEPTFEMASNTQVVGHAPSAAAASAPAAASEAASSGAATSGAATSAPAAAAAEPTAAPAHKLPKTGSPVPLAGLLGLLFVGGARAVRRLRRS